MNTAPPGRSAAACHPASRQEPGTEAPPLPLTSTASQHPPANCGLFAIGNAIIDIISNSDEAFLARHRLAKGSMRLVDAEDINDLHRHIGPAVEICGGSAANVACGFAALGGDCAFTGRLGDDQPGALFLHDMHAQSIRTFIARDATRPTGRCLVLVTPDAQRTMRTHLGAASALCADDLNAEALARAKIILLEGYAWAGPGGGDILSACADIARRCAAKIALSLPNPEAIRANRAALHAGLRDSIDILFGNEEEMLALYDAENFSSAINAARTGGQTPPRLIALTRSARGSVLLHGDEMLEIPAQPVEAVDSTGAGDLYAAGLLYGLAQEWPLPLCGNLAARAAARIICQYGARPRASFADLVSLAEAPPAT